MQVECDRSFVARDCGPPEAAAVDAHSPLPHRVARARRLDLDHVGAEVTEQLSCERSGDEAAELEHAYAAERPGLRHERSERSREARVGSLAAGSGVTHERVKLRCAGGQGGTGWISHRARAPKR